MITHVHDKKTEDTHIVNLIHLRNKKVLGSRFIGYNTYLTCVLINISQTYGSLTMIYFPWCLVLFPTLCTGMDMDGCVSFYI